MESINKTNNGVKLLAAIMVMFMIVAGAAVVLSDESQAAGGNVATINGEPYPTLDAAITEAAKTASEEAPVTIDLIADAEIDTVTTLTNIKIDCHEFSITAKQNVTGGTIVGTTGETEHNELLIAGADNLTFNGIAFQVSAYQNSVSMPYAINTGSNSVTITNCTFQGDSIFGAIHTNSNAAVVTVTVNECDFGNYGMIVYKGCTLNVTGTAQAPTEFIMNFIEITGGEKTVSNTNLKLTYASISNTIIGWEKAALAANTEEYTGVNSTDVSLTKSIDLGNVTRGSAMPSTADTVVSPGAGAIVKIADMDPSVSLNADPNAIVEINGNLGLRDTLRQNLTITSEMYLGGNLTIPEGITMTIAKGGVLDLASWDLTVEGDLIVENGGVITSKSDSNVISLKETGSLQNSGTIGKDRMITVSNGEKSGQSVQMKEVNGLDIQLVRTLTPAGKDFNMFVSGDVTKISGAKNPTLNTVGVGINADMTVGKDITFNVKGAVVSKNVTLTFSGKLMTIDSTSEGFLELLNGAKFVVDAPVVGTVLAHTGDIESGDKFTTASENVASSMEFKDKGVSAGTGSTDAYVTGITISVGRVTVPVDGESVVKQRLYVSGTADLIADKGVKDPVGAVALTGTAFVDDTLYVPEGLIITQTAQSGQDNPGIIDVSAAGTIVVEDEDADILNYSGARYVVETTVEGVDTATVYYTNFTAAMEQIASVDTIYVAGNYDITGTYELASGQEIAVETTNTYTGITVAESSVITVADGADVDAYAFRTIEGRVVVIAGTGYDPSENDDIYAVYAEAENGDVTYSGFKVALDNASEGQTITVVGSATYDGNMTVISGVTVAVEEGIVLTVTGNVTVNEGGKIVLDAVSELAVGDENRDSTVTVSGVLDASEGGTIAKGSDAKSLNVYSTGTLTYNGPITSVDINAAYYTEGGEYVYTSIAKAVAFAEQNALPSINATGTFTETGAVESDGVDIIIDNNAKVTLGSVTLNDASIYAKQKEGQNALGQYTAEVSGLAGTGDAAVTSTVSVSKFSETIANTITLDAQGASSYALTISAFGTGLSVTAGTVTFMGTDISTSETAPLSIASGAILVIGKSASISGEHITSDGTVQIAKDVVLTVDDDTVMPGTVAVLKGAFLQVDTKKTLTVTGDLTVDSEGIFTVYGTLEVGASPELLTDNATGSVTGKVVLNGNAFVFDGASVADASFTKEGASDVLSTAYTVNGQAYASIYTFDSTAKINGIDSYVKQLKDLVTYVESGKTPIQSEIIWYSGETDVSSQNVGKFAEVSTEIRYNSVGITISIGSHITLTIDGVVVNAFNGQDDYKLTIGEHEVKATVDAGYSGTVAITFNGQTVTDGKITVTSDMLRDQVNAIVLSAIGEISQDQTIIPAPSSGDSGMGLTDYLLIILVVLIVVMAIIVAMRLMRS